MNIISIEEIQDDGKNDYSGFKVTLDDGSTWEVLIGCGQSCCENYGYAVADGADVEYYIGAELLSVKRVDKAGAVVEMHVGAENNDDYDEGGIVFVNFETDRGLFQLTIYNAHNGYYGHNAKIVHNGNAEADIYL